ncbi:MAG: C-terminal binding protein [Micromonosporaceae bacterium]|nr:C-terminal binding protein [Micromonosporaceae bacterium]
MPDVVVTDQAFGGVEREQAVAAAHGCTFAAHQARTEDEVLDVVAGARIVFVNFAPITAKVLGVLAPGAVVIRYGIGYDNVDLVAARQRGVAVCNVPDYGAEAVADHTVAMLLASLRRLVGFTTAIRDSGWVEPVALGSITGFDHATVGLIGTGRVGRAVIARLRPFGFRIVAHDPLLGEEQIESLGATPVSLDRLLAEADAVTLHAPLTSSTRHLIDSDTLARIKPGAVIVNTARGALIDESALVEALSSGRVGAAALDVFEREPLPPDAPLRAAANVILTPHAAFFSDTSLANLQRLAAEEADRALAGKPLRCRLT